MWTPAGAVLWLRDRLAALTANEVLRSFAGSSIGVHAIRRVPRVAPVSFPQFSGNAIPRDDDLARGRRQLREVRHCGNHAPFRRRRATRRSSPPTGVGRAAVESTQAARGWPVAGDAVDREPSQGTTAVINHPSQTTIGPRRSDKLYARSHPVSLTFQAIPKVPARVAVGKDALESSSRVAGSNPAGRA